MTDLDADEERRLARWLFVGSPLVIFASTLGPLYVTFLVTRAGAPGLLGQVADRPAMFAALIALLALPMHIAAIVALSGRTLKDAWTGITPPPPPIQTGWRRLGRHLLAVLPDIVAATIVYAGITQPSAQPLWPLLAITVLGPMALTRLIRGLGVTVRWGWRRWTNRGHRPQHATPAD